VLTELCKRDKPLPLANIAKSEISVELIQRLQRRGLLEIREVTKGRKRKTQRIITWKGEGESKHADAEKLQRLRLLLETERGPLPVALPQVPEASDCSAQFN